MNGFSMMVHIGGKGSSGGSSSSDVSLTGQNIGNVTIPIGIQVTLSNGDRVKAEMIGIKSGQVTYTHSKQENNTQGFSILPMGKQQKVEKTILIVLSDS
jgi:hypothetical protein